MRTFVVDLAEANDFAAFVAAFSSGFCHQVGGNWNGNRWDAFNDYLSWPEEEQFRLVFRHWQAGRALSTAQRELLGQVLKDNPHVKVAYE